MNRVVIVPIIDVAHFPDLVVIAQDGTLAALVGPTAPGRMREAFDSDEDFLNAVSCGFADRYSFHTLDDGVLFAERKLKDLARRAKEIEEAIALQPRQPMPERKSLLEKQKPA